MAGLRRVGRGFEFAQTRAGFEQFKLTAPRLLAEQSKNHFVEGFRKGGKQTDASKSGWQARKQDAVRNSGRAILVDTGALRRSITTLKATWKSIIIDTIRIPYADRHNEGLTDKLGRKMPKRELIGESKDLDEKNKALLSRLIARLFV